MSTFTVTRSIVAAAPAEAVFGLIDDFRQWQRWSPWGTAGAQHAPVYSGPPRGPGAGYAWRGDRTAGAGRMRITAVVPGERIEIALSLLKPFAADNRVLFTIETFEPGLVRVTWTMTGETGGPMRVLHAILPLERIAGRDFDKGLAALKLCAEGA